MSETERKPFILVVDDDDLHALTLAQHMRRAGYSAATAMDAVSAMASIDGYPPDLILLDINMPGLDGLDLCRYLKTTLRERDIPTVVMTAMTGNRAQERALDAGADAFLSKPIQLKSLLETVRANLRTRQPA